MATWRQRITARLLHLYPLASGCGTIANLGVVQAIAGRSNEVVWANTRHGRLKCSLADYIGRAAFYTGELDPKVSWIIRKLVKPGDVTLDIGANLGLITLLLAQCVGPDGRVYAFEPNPGVALLLEQTLADNDVRSVTLHKIGLGSKAGELTLSVPKSNAGAASFVRSRDGNASVQVPVRTLSAFVEERGIERIDFIKMDVEGFEADVLRGAVDVLSSIRPKAILFELNDPGAEVATHETIRLLTDSDYCFFSVPKCLWRVRLQRYDPRKDTPPDSNDFLAVPREEHERVANLMRC